MSPTQRSLAELKKRGATAAVVERFNAHARVRQDLFGVIDLVALEPGQLGVLGLQVCSAVDHARRRAKILDEPRAQLWVACGNRLVLMSWGKRGARGRRKRWTPREQAITLEDFSARHDGPDHLEQDQRDPDHQDDDQDHARDLADGRVDRQMIERPDQHAHDHDGQDD